MKKLFVFYTDGGNREDGHIFFCDYLVVESATLAFNELFFSDTSLTGDQFYAAATTAGYQAERLKPYFVRVDEV